MRKLIARQRDYRIISIEDFLKLTEKDKVKIRDIKIIPPDLDDADFGYMQVFYKSPIYEIGASDG